jgi:hypothetical protein
VVVVGGGWDSTYDLNLLGISVAALRRGYHGLIHDGPGQSRLLVEEGLPLRHDWEKVITPDEVAAVGCPTLVTAAESDPVSSNAKDFYDGLTCPKTFIKFLNADGAGAQCEAVSRSMANRLIIDWLDEALEVHR